MYKYFTLILLFFVSYNRSPYSEILNEDLEKKLVPVFNWLKEFLNRKYNHYLPCDMTSIQVFYDDF